MSQSFRTGSGLASRSDACIARFPLLQLFQTIAAPRRAQLRGDLDLPQRILGTLPCSKLTHYRRDPQPPQATLYRPQTHTGRAFPRFLSDFPEAFQALISGITKAPLPRYRFLAGPRPMSSMRTMPWPSAVVRGTAFHACP